MKKLIIVRHGDYDRNTSGKLTLWGRDKIRALSKKIGVICKGLSVRILASTSPRGVDTARIIGKSLKTEVEPREVFWSEPDGTHDPDINQALNLITECDLSDVVIVVTHLEYTDELPDKFGKTVLKTNSFPISEELPRGDAWLIDCVGKTCVRLAAYG